MASYKPPLRSSTPFQILRLCAGSRATISGLSFRCLVNIHCPDPTDDNIKDNRRIDDNIKDNRLILFLVLPCLPTATHRLKCRLQNTKESAAGETIGEEIAEAIAAPFDDTVRLLPMSPPGSLTPNVPQID